MADVIGPSAFAEHVATELEAVGYTDVRKYREGIQDWTAAGRMRIPRTGGVGIELRYLVLARQLVETVQPAEQREQR
ncbi:hypothetical protein ACWEKR_27290 [Nocardia sp. NPDC004573]